MWLFRFFKDEITAEYRRYFDPAIKNIDLVMREERYKFERLKCTRLVNDLHSWRIDQEVYEASLHVRNELSRLVFDIIDIKTRPDHVSNCMYVEGSIVVGVKINNESKTLKL